MVFHANYLGIQFFVMIEEYIKFFLKIVSIRYNNNLYQIKCIDNFFNVNTTCYLLYLPKGCLSIDL